MTRDPVVEAALDALDCLAGQRREAVELPGGLTNRNFRVRTATRDVVVRISSPSTGLLAVDRGHEHANALAAAAAGIGPAVVEYLPGRGVLVVEYVPSRTLDDDDVAASLDRVASAVRELHEARPFANRFDMVEVWRGYLGIVRAGGHRVPHGYLDHLPTVELMENALRARPEPVRPCHNDLLAANFLDDGDRLWIIDYEYSGNNEPSFELGNLAQEAGLDDDGLAELTRHYYGHDDPVRTDRARLWSVMASYGWTLWGAIQHATSDLDVDFWEWGLHKYDTALAAFGAPDFEDLLGTVARGGGHG